MIMEPNFVQALVFIGGVYYLFFHEAKPKA